jgi:integrase
MTLLQLVKKHNQHLQKRIGIDYTFSTFQKYDILYNKLLAFIPHQYKQSDIDLSDVNYAFAADFDFYLRSVDKNQHNTVVKYLINLKRVFNEAVLLETIEKNPIAGFKARYKDVERVYLTYSELNLIRNKTFKLERLNRTRDLFIFQCFTGLAYSDMALLAPYHISKGIDDTEWIYINRKKTGIRSAIPLLSPALSIIRKYRNEQQSFVLPCYAIQKFNEYLYEIALACGITKNLTSHVGRRTFATTIALNNGVSIETVSKILGHTSTKITQQYAVVTDLKISKEINALRNVLQNMS